MSGGGQAMPKFKEDQMAQAMSIAETFTDLLHEIGGGTPGSMTFASRDLSLANTHMEDAVMRAVRHLTK